MQSRDLYDIDGDEADEAALLDREARDTMRSVAWGLAILVFVLFLATIGAAVVVTTAIEWIVALVAAVLS